MAIYHYKGQAVGLLVLILLTILCGCRSGESDSANIRFERICVSGGAKIVFVLTEYDFGKIEAGAKKSCSFDFINDGGQDLVIKHIHASCGCTTTTTANTTLKPGQASAIEVAFKAGSSNGKTKKQVTVFTNDPEKPQVALWVSADVFGGVNTAKEKSALSKRNASRLTPATPKRDDMPKALKQRLRNLNRATGG